MAQMTRQSAGNDIESGVEFTRFRGQVVIWASVTPVDTAVHTALVNDNRSKNAVDGARFRKSKDSHLESKEQRQPSGVNKKEQKKEQRQPSGVKEQKNKEQQRAKTAIPDSIANKEQKNKEQRQP
jgi:hypothetical protein